MSWRGFLNKSHRYFLILFSSSLSLLPSSRSHVRFHNLSLQPLPLRSQFIKRPRTFLHLRQENLSTFSGFGKLLPNRASASRLGTRASLTPTASTRQNKPRGSDRDIFFFSSLPHRSCRPRDHTSDYQLSIRNFASAFSSCPDSTPYKPPHFTSLSCQYFKV